MRFGKSGSGKGVMSAAKTTGRPWMLIVDDDDAFRALVSNVLPPIGMEMREAKDGGEALSAVRSGRPALVIIDVDLPDVSGYEVCRELRNRYGEDLPIVFVSGVRVEPYDRAGGILLGADDYIVKPFDPGELLARVRRLASRAARRAPTTEYDLTRREQEVLQLLANGLAQAEIARRLFISSKTVATHIQRLLAKLGVHSRAQAIALAHHEHLVVAADRPRPPRNGSDFQPHGAPNAAATSAPA
jgi:DNA-binding NarL/FixJ family response regulator